MTHSLTAAVREQAAQLCSAMASTLSVEPHAFHVSAYSLGYEPNVDIDALAWSAYKRAAAYSVRYGHEPWALAHAMLMNDEVQP